MTAASGGPAHASRPRGRKAAEQATGKNSLQLRVPGVGTLTLPPPDQLAFLAGIAALAALEIVEWPVAFAVAAGYALACAHATAAEPG